MATFGNRPEDSVTDSKGNVRPGVVITVFATEADATANRSALDSESTGADGRWPIDLPGRTVVWAREPMGSVWSVASDTALSDHETRLDTVETELPNKLEAADVAGKADVTYVDTGLAAKIDTATADATYGTLVALAEKAAKDGLPFDGSNAAGVDKTGVTDSAAAIQAVLDANAQVADVGIQKVVRLQGVFNLGTTGITIKGSVDAENAVFHCSGAGRVKIGDAAAGQLQLINVKIGDIICDDKPAGASWTAGSVGLEVRNTFRSTISYKRIIGFETGLLGVGDASYGLKGVAYNTFMCGSLNNNKVNQSLQFSGVGGFCNQNVFLGGSWSHADGTYPQAGVRHILIGTTGGGSLNNNLWVNASLEGGLEEYILDIYGNDNTWLNCRFEFVTNPPPVIWRAVAARNLIIGGYQSGALSQTVEAGAISNSIISAQSIEFEAQSDGGLIVSNVTGGTSSGVTVMRAGWRRQGDTTAANYTGRLGPGYLKLKTQADTNDRFNLNIGLSNFITMGPGNTAGDTAFGRASAGVFGIGTVTLPTPTTTTAPAAGAGGALPATPAGYVTVNINGAARKIAYY